MEKYNGWANYPTWNIKLWIDNNEGDSSYWAERAQDIYNDAAPVYDWETKESNAACTLADELKEYFEDNSPAADNMGTYIDIMSWALGLVDWREIAESMIEDVDKEDEVIEEEE